jgi:hypothetical protein
MTGSPTLNVPASALQYASLGWACPCASTAAAVFTKPRDLPYATTSSRCQLGGRNRPAAQRLHACRRSASAEQLGAHRTASASRGRGLLPACVPHGRNTAPQLPSRARVSDPESGRAWARGRSVARGAPKKPDGCTSIAAQPSRRITPKAIECAPCHERASQLPPQEGAISSSSATEVETDVGEPGPLPAEHTHVWARKASAAATATLHASLSPTEPPSEQCNRPVPPRLTHTCLSPPPPSPGHGPLPGPDPVPISTQSRMGYSACFSRAARPCHTHGGLLTKQKRA